MLTVSTSELNPLIERLVQKHANSQWLNQWAFVELERPLTIDFYKTWIEAGLHADMKYLETHLPLKENPQNFWAPAHTAIVFTASYFPFPEAHKNNDLKHLKTALYSKGADYHYWFKSALQEIANDLSKHFGTAEFLAMTDSSPVLERDLAAKGGLGWFGKNTCLIHPKKGSLFFIGEIYSSLHLAQQQLPHLPAETRPTRMPDFCGTCQKCITACPTQALNENRQLNASRCISYLTIESKSVPPLELRESIGDWFFGCDICQTVCPWNQKTWKSEIAKLTQTPISPDSTTQRENAIVELRQILTLSGKRLQKQWHQSPLLRAGPFGLRRNAIIVATNLKLFELRQEIYHWHKEKKLTELVDWSLQILDKNLQA